jgi:hypothetical protein
MKIRMKKPAIIDRMKASAKKAKSRPKNEVEDEDEELDPSAIEGEDDDWAYTSPEAQKVAVQRQKLQSNRNRAPEFYLKDGEDKDIRFRSDDPIAIIYRYQVKVNGKWIQVTKPKNGDPDLMNKKGIKPTMRAIYEVIDIRGFTDKEGKKHKNIPRFWAVSGRVHETIQAVRAKVGSLVKQRINVARRGQQTQTTYALIPVGKEMMTPEQLKAPKLAADFRKYYAPPSIEEQRAFIGGIDEDDDE